MPARGGAPGRAEELADGRENLLFAQRLLGAPCLEAAATRWSGSASAMRTTCRWLTSRPASGGAWPSPGCWFADRPLWLLDEPSAALDTASQAVLAELMDEHRAGGGLVIAAGISPSPGRRGRIAHRRRRLVPPRTVLEESA